ncbi:MAG TPA: helix-turn-helix transcriptional regulator [Anaerolineae bacterium]
MKKNSLTVREYQIAMLVATGAANKEIGRELGISPQTVKNVLTNIYTKTGTHSRTELAVHVVHSEYRRPASTRSPSTLFPDCTKRGCPFFPGKLRRRRST